jgi:small ligand-binding sensory domain FIST
MQTDIFTAHDASITLCFENIYKQIEIKNPNYDFLLFSIHPDYRSNELDLLIEKIFSTKNYVLFYALNTFQNTTILEEAVTVCSFRFQKRGKITTFYLDKLSNENNTLDGVKKTATYLNGNQDKFHIILATLCANKIADFINEVSPLLEYQPINNIVGGVSSGIKIENDISTNGLVILSFENVSTSMDVSIGFDSYGITYEINRAEGTKLYSVDDGKSFPYMMNKILDGIEDKKIQYLWYTPLSIMDTEKGYMSTLRTVKSITDDYVELFASVKKGDFFKLSFATPDDLINEDRYIAKTLANKFKNPEIAFNFSCVARQYTLEDRQEEELKAYMSLGTTLFGFFTFGEIGPDKMFKKLKFYNETSLVVVMKEI